VSVLLTDTVPGAFGRDRPADPVVAAVQALKAGGPVVLVDESVARPAQALAVVGADGGRSWEVLAGIGDGTLLSLPGLSSGSADGGNGRPAPESGWSSETAAATLLRVAGVTAAAALTRFRSPEQNRSYLEDAQAGARRLGAPVVTVQEVERHGLSGTVGFDSAGPARLPTAFGDFDARCYRFAGDEAEHLVLTSGPGTDRARPTLFALHRECHYGDVFGDLWCGCRRQLDDSLAAVAASGSGVLVYLRGTAQTAFEVATKVHTVLGDLGVTRVRVDASTQAQGAIEEIVPTVPALLAALGSRTCHSRSGEPR